MYSNLSSLILTQKKNQESYMNPLSMFLKKKPFPFYTKLFHDVFMKLLEIFMKWIPSNIKNVLMKFWYRFSTGKHTVAHLLNGSEVFHYVVMGGMLS